jgi:hypothetical protein
MIAGTRYATQQSSHHLVAALFTDGIAMSDAISDLEQAGFNANDIGVAFSAETRRSSNPPNSLRAVSNGKHSFIWKLRRRFERDLHSLQVNLSTGEENGPPASFHPVYSELALDEVLSGMGVTRDRILLLDSEIGRDGALMLVDAGDRTREVQSILERNCGLIRTDMATERSSRTASSAA